MDISLFYKFRLDSFGHKAALGEDSMLGKLPKNKYIPYPDKLTWQPNVLFLVENRTILSPGFCNSRTKIGKTTMNFRVSMSRDGRDRNIYVEALVAKGLVTLDDEVPNSPPHKTPLSLLQTRCLENSSLASKPYVARLFSWLQPLFVVPPLLSSGSSHLTVSSVPASAE